MKPIAEAAWPTGLFISDSEIEPMEVYVALLRKWSASINLVSTRSLADVWSRHVLDSARLMPFCPPEARHWVDLGSGAGFPGMVVAILAKHRIPGMRITLVESDARKAAFLRTVSRETGTQATVLGERIEDALPLNADVVSARALAPLPELCGLACRHLSPAGIALFLKGATVDDELAEARVGWQFRSTKLDCGVGGDGCVLRLEGLAHA